jgi:aldehyde dehydrogenase (NAD+)
MGPVTTPGQLDRVLGFVADAVAEGATVAAGGRRAEVDGLPAGLFVAPTILAGVRPEMRVAREEVFGPVLSVLPFDDEQEAVALANDSPYGLAAGVWTGDVKRAHRVTRLLDAGTVWVNMYRTASPAVPVGGSGLSGYGRENGVQAIEAYTRTKSVWVELGDTVQDPFVQRY